MAEKKPPPEMGPFALVMGSLVLLFFLSMAALVIYGTVRRVLYGTGETTEQRIERLTKSLSESVQLITEIEKEIEKRNALASKLQSDITTYDQLVKLKQPEVEAVAQLLRGEFEQERRHALLQDFSLHSGFFVFGILADRLFERFRRRRELRREEQQNPSPAP